MAGCVSFNWIAVLSGRLLICAEGVDMPAHQVLQRGGNKEIFLPQPQFLPRRGGVGRIQHLGDRLGPDLRRQRPGVVAVVERIQPQRIRRLGGPQAQRVDPAAAPADGGRVVGDRLDRLGRVPDMPHRRLRHRHRLDRAAEADRIAHLRPVEFPRIAQRQPVLGIFVLPAVLHHLAEQPVLIADAVAVGGDVQRRHAFHEARGQPTEAAIAERRVGLERRAACRDRRSGRPGPPASSRSCSYCSGCRTAGVRSRNSSDR